MAENNFSKDDSNCEIAVCGQSEFVSMVRVAIELLSHTSSFSEEFCNAVDCIKQVTFLKFEAGVRLKRGKGTILIRKGVQLEPVQLCMLLSHEACHNVIFQQYANQYGLFWARYQYQKELSRIERECIAHEIKIGTELRASEQLLSRAKILYSILPNDQMIKEQTAWILKLRKKHIGMFPSS